MSFPKQVVLALLLVGGMVAVAPASIIHYQPISSLSAYSNNSGAIPLNIRLNESDAWSELSFEVSSSSMYMGGGIYSWESYTKLNWSSTVKLAADGESVLRLDIGDTVGPDSSFAGDNAMLAYYYAYGTGSYTSGQFGGGSTEQGYVGFRAEDGVNTYYGWMRLEVRGNTDQRITVYEWAMNDTPDAPVTVGLIPEPATLALLALGGAAGVFRKRRS